MHAGNYSLKTYEKKYPLAVECVRHLKSRRLSRAHFAQQLKVRREKLKMDKKEIASSVGITVRAYNLYEQGQRIPRPDILFKLAIVLKTSIREVTGCKK